MDHQWTPALEQWLREQAIDAGFNTAGIASVDPAPGDVDAQRFADWIAQGRAGEMDYLKRRDDNGTLLRSAVQTAIPWARSVIVCALNYNAAAPLSTDPAPPNTGWIARYAWSGHANPTNPADLTPTDYHNQLLTRLRIIETTIKQRFASETPSENVETRCYVDTGPLVERAAAARAGVGWIGKNTCVINQQLGSWLLLGVVITSIPIAAGAVFSVAEDRCGSCTRCIDACPTDALVAPHQMDASRCIAYLTIEKKGSIPADLRAPIGRQVFGCDICQDVCPWNKKSHPRQSSAQDLAGRWGRGDRRGCFLLFDGEVRDAAGGIHLMRGDERVGRAGVDAAGAEAAAVFGDGKELRRLRWEWGGDDDATQGRNQEPSCWLMTQVFLADPADAGPRCGGALDGGAGVDVTAGLNIFGGFQEAKRQQVCGFDDAQAGEELVVVVGGSEVGGVGGIC